jgi:uncharacterized protein (DUF1015 family)
VAEIQPLRAIRYRAADLGALVAPPYDILDAPEKKALLARNPRNIVALDLPHTPPKEAGPQAEYAAAARTLEAWLADGTLARDEAPALYVYHQRFAVEGRSYVRRMFFARLRLEPFGSGRVFPHEQTFGGPKEDRLRLMRATRCQLSPIFGLYPDAANRTAAALDAAAQRAPDAFADADGVENRLWVVCDPAAIGRVREEMLARAVYIADGHHRYTTALNYRDELASASPGGRLPPEHPAHFVLTVFLAMEDPGALILPTHRVVVDRPGQGADLLAALVDRFDRLSTDVKDSATCAAALPANGPQAIGVFDGATGRYTIIRPKDADVLSAVEPGRAAAWRRLSYAILHRYVIDEVLTRRLGGGSAPAIHYVKPLADAVAEARAARGVAFLMQPCTMAELRDVCAAGELMPQKTTYFYPKLATGLVINPLD